MAQHDYVIDNGSGLAVRTDFNAVLQAIVSFNSGPTEPTTKFAGMWWLDTAVTPNVMRQRNSANSAWINPQIAGASPSVPGNDGKTYGMKDGAWVDVAAATDLGYVKKAGDRMTGALQVRGAAIADIFATTAIVGRLSAEISVDFNCYVNGASTAVNRIVAGYASRLFFDQATGQLSLQSGTSVAAGAAGVFTDRAVFDFVNGKVKLGLNIEFAATGVISALAGAHTTTFNNTGGITVSRPTTSHGVLSYGSASVDGLSGVLGFGGGGTAIYGALGIYIASQGTWGCYSNAGAYAVSGWTTSDGVTKAVTGEADGAAELANVLAIPVKVYEPSSPAARAMFNLGKSEREAGEGRIGWLAQDIEPVIPEAVREVGLPSYDLVQRAAVKMLDHIPDADSDEGKALAAEDLSIKAMNINPMVATLWAAVQHLSAKVDALQAAQPAP